MSNKPRERCEHGYSLVYMQGCPHCTMLAMDALGFLKFHKMNVPELVALLQQRFKSDEELQAAIVEARELIASRAVAVRAAEVKL